MANKMSDAEHQASLDKNFPYIEHGAEPPGRWLPDPLSPGSQKWFSHKHWSTRHGDAVVRWGLGRPVRIDFALYPDGTRGVVREDGYGGWRRLAANRRNWIHGAIQIKPEDVVFIDGEQPVYAPPQKTAVPNLEADLAHDAAFLDALQDDDFADATYTVLKNQCFYKGEERGWRAGNGVAATLVANLRGLGESHSDWDPWGHCGDEHRLSSVYDQLARIGWRAEANEDRQRTYQRRVAQIPFVLEEIKELEKRPERAAEQWTELFKRNPLHAPDALALNAATLLRALALSGRISKEEYEGFSRRLDLWKLDDSRF
jgi:hypothetical protein